MNQITKDAQKYVAIAVEYELMRGKGGYFDPQGDLTRAEVAQLLYNILKKQEVEEEKVVLEDEILYGDVNGDGKVNMDDAVLLPKYVSRTISASKINMKNSDVNNDTKVNMEDVIILIRFVSKADTTPLPLKHDCNGTKTSNV